MKIQELERLTGLDRATIRYYEREGLICPNRGENGYRNYTEEEADSLLKIRLLRQLGMPLQQIRQLQDGKADLRQALADQTSALAEQIKESRRAREICQQIGAVCGDYRSLDAAYYLRLLEQPVTDAPQTAQQPFREPLPQEIHPWRRYFARSLDLALIYTPALFLLIVAVRVRPVPGLILQTLLLMACMAIQVPAEALMLKLWGTTPGKWIFGIHLESCDDRYLTWEEALGRSWGVYSAGMGFGIPFVRLFCNQMAYCTVTGRSWRRFARYDDVNPPYDTSWDYGVEATYTNTRWKGLALALAVLLTLSVITGMDSIKPRYRGENLTVFQFAKNYNALLSLLGKDLDKLEADGAVRDLGDNWVTVHLFAMPENEHAGFGYETEAGFITAITYENSWTEVIYLDPLDGMCYQATASVLLVQDGVYLRELKEFEELWNANLGESEADFSYHGIRICWRIDMENCKPADPETERIFGKCLEVIDPEQPSRVELYFRLEP